MGGQPLAVGTSVIRTTAGTAGCWGDPDKIATLGPKPRRRTENTMMSRLAGWIIVILIVVWIVSNPAAAGTSVHGWATDVVAFLTHLARG
jgi:hypothetical protein